MEEPHRLPDDRPLDAGITTGLYPDAAAKRFCCPSPEPKPEDRPDPSPDPKPEVRLEVSPDSDGSEPKPEPIPDPRPDRPKLPNPDGGGLRE